MSEQHPQRIGKYRIIRMLGRGGMGVVYLGRDDSLSRLVAVKVVNPRMEGVEVALRRFGREARAIASLSDPHIVHIYEFNSQNNPPYLAMEYVPGGGLDGFIQCGPPFTWAEVLDALRQILAGIAAAHKVGIVHRDVKPANILCSREGVYKLTDFGLARGLAAASGGGSLTATGAIIGSIRYLAPEVAAGEEATTLSDLYSVGVSAYEIISGRTPFSDPSPLRLVRQIAAEPPAPIKTLRADIPPALEAWLDHVLQRKPSNRYASADEALEALSLLDFGPLPKISRFASIPLPEGAGDDAEATPDGETIDLAAPTRDLPAAAHQGTQIQVPVERTVTVLTEHAPPQPRTARGVILALLGVLVFLCSCLPLAGTLVLCLPEGLPWVDVQEMDGTVTLFGPGQLHVRRPSGTEVRIYAAGVQARRGAKSRIITFGRRWLLLPSAVILLMGGALGAFMVWHGLHRRAAPEVTRVIVGDR